MDQGTIQTILEGGIFVALAIIAKNTSTIASKSVPGDDDPNKTKPK